MIDKIQKIREMIEKRYECWREKELNSHSIESEIRMSECQHLLLMLNSLQEEPVSKQKLSNVQRTVKNCKEPVSEDLSDCINKLSKQFQEVSFAKLSRIAVRVAKWQKEQMMKDVVYGLVCGHDESSPAWIDLNLLNKPNVKVGTEVKLIIIEDDIL